MLEVEHLEAWYGEGQALHDVSLRVRTGEVATLVGRNGAGKTTTLRCIMGMHRNIRGRIALDGVDLTRLSPQRIARLGVGYVQDDRGIYGSLSVLEHLLLPPAVSEHAWTLEKIFEVFPILRERARYPGTRLSGGEQQMLAIARVLRMGARLLLLDEPTEGLAPTLIHRIGEIIQDIKAHRLTVLLVEQNLRFATTVADRHHLIADGRTVEDLANEEVVRREHQLLEYLGV